MSPDRDGALVEQFARVLRKLRDVDLYLEDHGTLDETGEPRRALAAFRSLSSELRALASALGLSPQAAASLGVKVAAGRSFDLAAEMSRARTAEKGLIVQANGP